MRGKIQALLKRAESTIHEAEKQSCLNLAKKLCNKHDYDFNSFLSSTKDSFRSSFRQYAGTSTTDDFTDAWEEFVNKHTRVKRSIQDLYTFKNSFYTSPNGNLTFFADGIRITIIEHPFEYDMCIDGVWYNDIDDIGDCYIIAYNKYMEKTK